MRKRNKFNLSNYKLLTGNMGYLYPIGFYEVLPGDSFKASSTLLVRCQPMVTPVMHPVNVTIHHFFVPYRLIWDKFEDFITGGADGNDDQVVPVLDLAKDNLVAGSLANYFGIPPVDVGVKVNALPFFAYNLIWNEFYRDQDLQKAIKHDNVSLLKVNVEKDYFSSARPSPQKGTAVTMPLDISIPDNSLEATVKHYNAHGDLLSSTPGLNAFTGKDQNNSDRSFFGPPDSNVEYSKIVSPTKAYQFKSSLSINDLSTSVALQKWKEKRNMYGSRYTEYLASLGVKAADARLQRPEYLGGGQRTIQFSEIVNTGDKSDSPLGTLKGHGINSTRSNSFARFFSEHGLIMSFVFVRPKNLYSNSMPRYFMKHTRVDFWNKELEQVGQQPVYKSEVDFVHNTDISKKEIFGWTYNYDEYRKSFNTVAGNFSLGKEANNWHFAREFATAPVLNSDFIESNPTRRPFALTKPEVHQLLIMGYNSVKARRLVGHGKVTTL